MRAPRLSLALSFLLASACVTRIGFELDAADADHPDEPDGAGGGDGGDPETSGGDASDGESGDGDGSDAGSDSDGSDGDTSDGDASESDPAGDGDGDPAPPDITSLTPTTGSVAGATPVTIDGSGFLPGATVLLGATSCAVTSLTATQLTCISGPHAPGTVAAVVTNPDAQADSVAAAYTYFPLATILVPFDATWRYLDTGVELAGSGWNDTLAYDDAAWAVGPAHLGYGDPGIATTVGYGPDSGNRYITTYFRSRFEVADPSAFPTARLELVVDDGAVVFVNGTEVTRVNMPLGVVSATTLASSKMTGCNESGHRAFALDPGLLMAGTNFVAAQVHQESGGSSDVRFALEIAGLTTGAGDPDVRLVSAGDAWRYLDEGGDHGASFAPVAFDDSGWASGASPLGYGRGDEATVVGFGSDPLNKFITTYFRRSFTFDAPNAYASLLLRLQKDDAAVVYLNGVELYRAEVPGGHTAQSPATDLTNDYAGTVFCEQVLAPALFLDGENTLAVEVHQGSGNDADMRMSLELVGLP